MDLCATPVCCNFKVMLIFFAVFQFLSFQFSYNQRKKFFFFFSFLTRQNMTLHVIVYNAQFIVKTCKTICLARFQVFAPRAKISLFCSFWVQIRIRLALKGSSDAQAALLDIQPRCSLLSYRCMSKYCNLSFLQFPCSYSSLLSWSCSIFSTGREKFVKLECQCSRCDVVLWH